MEARGKYGILQWGSIGIVDTAVGHGYNLPDRRTPRAFPIVRFGSQRHLSRTTIEQFLWFRLCVSGDDNSGGYRETIVQPVACRPRTSLNREGNGDTHEQAENTEDDRNGSPPRHFEIP